MPPDCCDEDDLAILMYAAFNKKTNAVHVLVQRGNDVNLRKRKLAEVFIVNFKVVCILDDGVPSDRCDEDDLATLMYAAIDDNTKHHIRLAVELVDLKTRKRRKIGDRKPTDCCDDYTTLIYAAMNNKTNIHMLLYSGLMRKQRRM